MPWLLIEKGTERGRSFELRESDRAIIGRDAACEVVLDDKSCSRRHCGVVAKNGVWLVKDLESTHGTTVNGWRIDQADLKDGDAIAIGDTVISFALEDPSRARGLVGKTLAGYQLLERIGRGGMGTVYRAKQVALDRDVALKVLSAKYTDNETFVERFFKEAQAAARLNHPNVVQVYDVREEQGIFFISLELMSEGTVQDLVRQEGRLPVDRVLGIARDAAAGLVYAEKKKIVHGDIKPDNLMINADDHIKISDLGLARDAGDGSNGDEGIFGTPHFVSPEQALGKSVDSRSDIYSLGATLYRLIGGQTPHSGDSVSEIVRKQIHEEPTDLRELEESCPQDFADLVGVMMAKDPSERFATAEELVAALETLDDSGRLAATSGSSNLLKIGAGVVGLAVATGAAVFFLNGNGGAEDDPIPADPSTTNKANAAANAENGNDTTSSGDALAKERLELAARGEYLNAQSYHNERGATEDLDDVEVLEQIRDRYLAVVEEGPDTRAAEDARQAADAVEKRLDVVRTTAATREREREASAARARTTWADLETKVGELLTADRPVEALALVDEKGPSLVGSNHENDVTQLRSSVQDRTTTRVDAVLKNADADLLANRFDAGRTQLKHVLDGLGSPAAETLDWVASLRARVSRKLTELDAAKTARLSADRKADEIVLFTALRDVDQTLRRAFDPDAATSRLDEALTKIKTDAARQRLETRKATLAPLIRIRQRLVDDFAAGRIDERRVSGGRGLPAGTLDAVTLGEVTVKRRNGAKETRRWNEIDPTVLHRVLLRRLATSPDATLDLAASAFECGVIEESERHLDALADNPNLTMHVAALRRTVDAEKAALAALADITERYRRFKSDPRESFALRDAIQAFTKEHVATRAFLRSSDGTTPLLDAATKPSKGSSEKP